jgi:hypothetical protein
VLVVTTRLFVVACRVDATVEMLNAKLQESLVRKPNSLLPSRETEAFQEAKLAAIRLARASVDELLERDDCGAQIFLQLSNCLTLHARYCASLMTEEVEHTDSNVVMFVVLFL